ncbi:UNVERIFIED_CONTAM: hypothetical protein Sradi_6851500 [Sesamum radiatum]|uniref:RNase H type-1 domain-containing protein n=1 Tax=Sesamum radiatum TaxID=300843 RepID=A0AAW2JKN6_SESRA
MRMAHETGARHLLAYLDSQLVVKQVEGTYEVKEESMIQYLQQIANLKTKFHHFQIIQIPREENAKADSLSKLASSLKDCRTRHITIHYLPEARTPPRGLAHSHGRGLENSYNQMDRRRITSGESMGSCDAQGTSHPLPNAGACPLQDVLYTHSAQMFVYRGRDSHSTGNT